MPPFLLKSIFATLSQTNDPTQSEQTVVSYSDWVGSFSLVPVVGLEPTRCRQRRILNPLRLPIPSHRHVVVCSLLFRGPGSPPPQSTGENQGENLQICRNHHNAKPLKNQGSSGVWKRQAHPLLSPLGSFALHHIPRHSAS